MHEEPHWMANGCVSLEDCDYDDDGDYEDDDDDNNG